MLLEEDLHHMGEIVLLQKFLLKNKKKTKKNKKIFRCFLFFMIKYPCMYSWLYGFKR